MLMTRKRNPLNLPDLADLSWFPLFEPVIRIEEFAGDDYYTVRAELPGIDPAKDIEIVATDGVLRLVMVRTEETREHGHTEFRYGTFQRTIALPSGAREDTIAASYTDGILEVTMMLGESKAPGRHIPIAVPNGHGHGHGHGHGQPKQIKKN